jgi:hypothetical protein
MAGKTGRNFNNLQKRHSAPVWYKIGLPLQACHDAEASSAGFIIFINKTNQIQLWAKS